MSSDKYKVGQRIRFKKERLLGVVVQNYKFPGDICVDWATGMRSSYDEDFLDEHCERCELPTPDNTVPPQPTKCRCCGDPFRDGLPWALLRSYSTKPGHPEWAWWWVCEKCTEELSK